MYPGLAALLDINVPRAGSPWDLLVLRAFSPRYLYVPRAASPRYIYVPGAASPRYKKVPRAGSPGSKGPQIITSDNDQSRNCIILTQFPSQLLMMQRSGLCGVWNITIRLSTAPTPGSALWSAKWRVRDDVTFS